MSALLEILDPEQNHSFIDRYLEIPFDISKATFICTANDINNIPQPLVDRMDIINFRNYSYDERFIILKDYMLPKALQEYKLDVPFEDIVLKELAKNEQLRQIDRKVRKLLRAAHLNHKLDDTQYLITKKNLEVINLDSNAIRKPVGF